MNDKLTRQIREIIQVLNDEALFHAREVPGDQDDFENRPTQSIKDTGMIKYEIFEAIQHLIDLYDTVDEKSLSGKAASIIAHIKDDVDQLKRVVGKSQTM